MHNKHKRGERERGIIGEVKNEEWHGWWVMGRKYLLKMPIEEEGMEKKRKETRGGRREDNEEGERRKRKRRKHAFVSALRAVFN